MQRLIKKNNPVIEFDFTLNHLDIAFYICVKVEGYWGCT